MHPMSMLLFTQKKILYSLSVLHKVGKDYTQTAVWSPRKKQRCSHNRAHAQAMCSPLLGPQGWSLEVQEVQQEAWAAPLSYRSSHSN